MGVICFSSLKGGVGKTTLSLNVAGAFAERGCETLLIDLDPSAHSSRFFLPRTPGTDKPIESPLARLFLSGEALQSEPDESLIDAAVEQGIPFVLPVRPNFAVLPGGPELRHFLWGKAARTFKRLFARLIDELHSSYDYIIIDTPPDYNVLMRNAIAVSDLVVVPVDSSAMSIDCMEELLNNCAHIRGPQWCILRTMVNRQASRIQKLSTDRLKESVSIRSADDVEEEELIDSLQDADNFIAMIEEREPSTEEDSQADQSPIYLLNSVVARTEQQNRLSFQGRTAYDTKATRGLAKQYSGVARELEEMLSFLGEEESEISVADFLSPGNDAIERSA